MSNSCDFVRNNSKVRFVKEAHYRVDKPDYADRAVTEAIVNALIHRLWKAIHKRCYAKFIVMESRAA